MGRRKLRRQPNSNLSTRVDSLERGLSDLKKKLGVLTLVGVLVGSGGLLAYAKYFGGRSARMVDLQHARVDLTLRSLQLIEATNQAAAAGSISEPDAKTITTRALDISTQSLEELTLPEINRLLVDLSEILPPSGDTLGNSGEIALGNEFVHPAQPDIMSPTGKPSAKHMSDEGLNPGFVPSLNTSNDLVVIGSSLSSSFETPEGQSSDLGPPEGQAFADILAHIFGAAREPVVIASELFFLAPTETGALQVDKAVEVNASVVIALDYLFWFGYGTSTVDGGVITNGQERLELLEVGLRNLERLECAVFVGDLPDMSNSVGKMLIESQVPDSSTLSALNTRVMKWAEMSETRTVLPLSKILEAMRKTDEALLVGRHAFPANSTRRLIRPDDYHLTVTGLCVVARAVANSMIDAGLAAPDSAKLDIVKILDHFAQAIDGIGVIEEEAAGAPLSPSKE